MSDARASVRSSLCRFAYLYAILIVALPVVLGFVFQNQIYTLWVEQFEGPGFQREFGFRLERRVVTLRSGESYSRAVIIHVDPGGRFATLGVRPGDTLACLYHGIADFYGELALARGGYEAHFRLLSPDALQLGCDGAREITIAGRPLP